MGVDVLETHDLEARLDAGLLQRVYPARFFTQPNCADIRGVRQTGTRTLDSARVALPWPRDCRTVLSRTEAAMGWAIPDRRRATPRTGVEAEAVIDRFMRARPKE